VAFYGLDVVPEGAQQFVRSIPLAKALDANTIVATRMNHTGLMPEHGFPARALVPGWIGSCSIKWLSEIRVLKEEFQGFYMQSAYRMPRANSASQRSGPESDAITSLRVKSIITSPLDGALLPWAADITLLGAAWAGEQAIQKVEISTDGGHIWHSATLGSKSGRYAWHLWKREWNPQRPGSYLILSRATDDHGHSQPFQSKWNPGGYLWNGVDHVRVTLQA
jgi:DMSO/TMAO reductase YedYZ molybdopterin-dependent catalytic subunit